MDKLPPSSTAQNKILVLLDHITPLKAKLHKHLYGDELSLWEGTLKACGFKLSDIIYHYAVPYLVPKVTTDIIHQNTPLLRNTIEHLQPSRILVCGGVAHAVLHGYDRASNVQKVRGRGEWYEIEGRKIYTLTTFPPYQIKLAEESFRDITQDLIKFRTHTKPMIQPKVDLWIPETVDECYEALKSLQQYPFVSCDTETTGFNPLSDQITTIGFGALYHLNNIPQDKELDFRLEGVGVTIPKEIVQNQVVKDMVHEFLTGETYKGTIVYHNAKFDLQFLQVYTEDEDFYTKGNFEDTILLSYIGDERPIKSETGRGISSHGLKTLSRVRYDASDYKFNFSEFQSIPEEQRDYFELYKYLSLDLIYTAQLYIDLPIEINEESPRLFESYNKILMPLTRIFTDLELQGTYINVPYFNKLKVETELQVNKTLEEMKQYIFEQATQRNLVIELSQLALTFNPNSHVQVKRILTQLFNLKEFEKTGTGKLVLQEWKDEESENYPEATHFLNLLLKYRELSKALSTFIVGLLSRVDSNNRVHQDFHCNGTSTGRLSCSNPNLQNIPILLGTQIRQAFSAPNGYVFFNSDYSQLELRVSAFITQDEKMKEIYDQDLDFHGMVSSIMFEKPQEEITKLERFRSKLVSFGTLYGRSALSLSKSPDVDWSIEESQKFIDNFLNGFPRFKEWSQDIGQFALSEHYVESPLGRRRRFPLVTHENKGSICRQAVNSPIQGSGSDICAYALTKLYNPLRKLGGQIAFTVHDSICGYLPKDRIDECLKLIKRTMETNPPFEMNVPLKVEIDTGENWGIAKEVKIGSEIEEEVIE